MSQGKYNLYWGELHTHTFCGNSTFGAIVEAAAIARTHLDFWAAGEHYNLWETPHPLFDWHRISGIIRESYDPGRFFITCASRRPTGRWPGVRRSGWNQDSSTLMYGNSMKARLRKEVSGRINKSGFD